MQSGVLPSCQVVFGGDQLAHFPSGLLDPFPQLIRDDPGFRSLLNPPLAARVVALDSPTRAGFMVDGLLTPDLASEVAFVRENPAHRALRPAFPSGAANGFDVQPFNNPRKARSVCRPREDAPHHVRFVGVDLDALARRAGWPLSSFFPEGSTTGMVR